MAPKKRSKAGGNKGGRHNNNRNKDHHYQQDNNDDFDNSNGAFNGTHPRGGGAKGGHHQKKQHKIRKMPSVDPSTQICRHVAIFRFFLFIMLIYTFWRHLPHRELDLKKYIVDAWMTFDQFGLIIFAFAPNFGPLTGAIVVFLSWLTVVLGVLTAISVFFRFSGTLFLLLWAFRFLLLAHTYRDRHYLQFLLGILTVITGGGSFFMSLTETDDSANTINSSSMTEQRTQQIKRLKLIQASEWAAVTLRLQYAIVFLFQALWKLHPDYLNGSILRENLVAKEEQPGIFSNHIWFLVEDNFGGLMMFQLMGMSGFVFDFAMFLLLALRRPTLETSRRFFLTCLVYHGWNALLFGNNTGHSFHLTCLVGVLVFHPIGGGSIISSNVASIVDGKDGVQSETTVRKRIWNRQRGPVEADLFTWLRRYATGSIEARATRAQQIFTLIWVAIQLIAPLRMPIVSRGDYPWTSRGTRYSWVEGLHSHRAEILHIGMFPGRYSKNLLVKEQAVRFDMFYLVPECKGHVLHRHEYMPEAVTPLQDPRSVPIRGIMKEEHYEFIVAWPRFMGRVAGGMSLIMRHRKPKSCGKVINHIPMYAVHFSKLNGKGALCRMFDPTVDLALGEHYRFERGIVETIKDVILDKAPTGHEFFLPQGIGTMNQNIEGLANDLRSVMVKERMRVEYVADRGACLAARPLALWPNDLQFGIVLLAVPDTGTMTMKTSNLDERIDNYNFPKDLWPSLSYPETTQLERKKLYDVKASLVELSISFHATEIGRCNETKEEDILMAFIFEP